MLWLWVPASVCAAGLNKYQHWVYIAVEDLKAVCRLKWIKPRYVAVVGLGWHSQSVFLLQWRKLRHRNVRGGICLYK